MILKLKTFNEALGQGWLYLDKIERIEKFPVTNTGTPKTATPIDAAIVIKNAEGAQTGGSDVAFDCINFFVYYKGEDTSRVYTELPAYLLNDKGETIERLN